MYETYCDIVIIAGVVRNNQNDEFVRHNTEHDAIKFACDKHGATLADCNMTYGGNGILLLLVTDSMGAVWVYKVRNWNWKQT